MVFRGSIHLQKNITGGIHEFTISNPFPHLSLNLGVCFYNLPLL